MNKYLKRLQNARYKLFEEQDPKTGLFDVMFEIRGQVLYTNKYILAGASKKLKQMLAGRKKEDPIVISEWSFEAFKEFVKYLYLGKCMINDDNAADLFTISDRFAIEPLKLYCETRIFK